MASPSSASGCSTPVDVSACTTASMRACGLRSSALISRSFGTASPQSASTSTTFAPWRRAISPIRLPK
jgi:hypothetical protein